MDAVVGNLYNELMCLCEIRGELSAEDNARVEDRILTLQFQIEKMEKASWVVRIEITFDVNEKKNQKFQMGPSSDS